MDGAVTLQKNYRAMGELTGLNVEITPEPNTVREPGLGKCLAVT